MFHHSATVRFVYVLLLGRRSVVPPACSYRFRRCERATSTAADFCTFLNDLNKEAYQPTGFSLHVIDPLKGILRKSIWPSSLQHGGGISPEGAAKSFEASR
jgi:hypothetical protein